MADDKFQFSTVLRKVGRHGWKWLTGIVIAAFAALLGGYATGLLNEVFPSATELACQFQEWTADHSTNDKLKPDPKFTILISRLDRDTDGSQTGHIISAFERHASVEVVPICRVLRIETGTGIPLSTLRTETEEEGRHWLKEHDADLLIWGEVAKADQVLRLRFTGLDVQKGTGASPYKLNDTILPKNFHEDFAVQLVVETQANTILSENTIDDIPPQALPNSPLLCYDEAAVNPLVNKLQRTNELYDRKLINILEHDNLKRKLFNDITHLMAQGSRTDTCISQKLKFVRTLYQRNFINILQWDNSRKTLWRVLHDLLLAKSQSDEEIDRSLKFIREIYEQNVINILEFDATRKALSDKALMID